MRHVEQAEKNRAAAAQGGSTLWAEPPARRAQQARAMYRLAALLLLVWLAGCGAGPGGHGTQPSVTSGGGSAAAAGAVGAHAALQELPALPCGIAKEASGPRFCAPEGEALPAGVSLAHYVVGLPPSHGWSRGDWVLLSKDKPGISKSQRAALAVVVEPYTDAAKVALLYELPNLRGGLLGAAARKVKQDERVRLSHFVARIDAQQGGRFRLDVGQSDGARQGQLYEVLDQHGDPAARLRLVEVGKLSAWALPVEQGASLHLRMSARFLKEKPRGKLERTDILVVNFSAQSKSNTAAVHAGERFARKLAQALSHVAGAHTGLKARYADNEMVSHTGSIAGAHTQARAIGKRHEADIVVWGSMRCSKRACALPRFTVVHPNRLARSSTEMHQVKFDDDGAGFALTQQDANAQASAMLGKLTHQAQRYGDAAYYLGRALPAGVLAGSDALQARAYLSEALYYSDKGHTLARLQAGKLVRQADIQLMTAKPAERETIRNWARWGKVTLADLDAREGRVKAARNRYRVLMNGAKAAGDEHYHAYALYQLAMLEAQQGRVSDARALYKQSFALWEQIGNVRGKASTLHALAILEAEQGRVSEARALYRQSLALKEQIGNVKGKASTLHQLAMFEAEQGRVSEARALYKQVLRLDEQIGNVQGKATTLHQLAILEAEQGRVSEARALYKQSLALVEQIGNVQGAIVTRMNLAVLDYQPGRRAAAETVLREALKAARARQYAYETASVADLLGQMRRAAGDAAEARVLWREARGLFDKLGMAKRRDKVDARLASLALGEQVDASAAADAAVRRGEGVVVTQVAAGGQARKAGMQAGDVLVRYGTTAIAGVAALQQLVKATPRATQVSLHGWHGKQRVRFTVHGGLLGIGLEEVDAFLPQDKP